jgi:hypothetical protein
MMMMTIQMMKAVMIMIHLSLKKPQLQITNPIVTLDHHIMLKEVMLQQLLVAKVAVIAEVAVAAVIMIKSMTLILLIKTKRLNLTQHSRVNCLKKPLISLKIGS